MGKTIIIKPTNAQDVIDFLNMSFSDYLGARVLLNNNLLLQGAILASTSIEKCLKAIAASRGNICNGHLKQAHLRILENFDKKLYDTLNLSFLKFLIKSYKMRYLDHLKDGFTLHISRKQFLAELDFTIFEIFKRFHFKSTKRGTIKLMYQELIENKDPKLYNNNYILKKISRNEFVKEQDYCYGVLKDHKMGLMEVFYEAEKVNDDGNFLKPGLKRN